MFPPPKKYSALLRKPTQADRSALYEDLKQYGWFTGLISPEPPVANKLPFPTIEEIIFSDKFLQARGCQQQLDCLVCRSRLQQAHILNISEVTVGQRDNPAWYLARKGRLTGSNFGSVLKAKRITPSLLKCLLGEYDLSRVKAVQWGVNNEEEAIKAFTLKTGAAVKETGIWFHSSGILGASPDGIIDEETVLEVKCPYPWPDVTYIHVGMYLLFSLSPYTQDQLMNYKSLDCYQNFANGWVREVFSKTWGKSPLNREGKVEEAIAVLFVLVFASHLFWFIVGLMADRYI